MCGGISCTDGRILSPPACCAGSGSPPPVACNNCAGAWEAPQRCGSLCAGRVPARTKRYAGSRLVVVRDDDETVRLEDPEPRSYPKLPSVCYGSPSCTLSSSSWKERLAATLMDLMSTAIPTMYELCRSLRPNPHSFVSLDSILASLLCNQHRLHLAHYTHRRVNGWTSVTCQDTPDGLSPPCSTALACD